VSYIITDIDGTLTTSGDTPRQDYIDWLKMEAADDKNVIIVSARSISRLDETRKWLNDNDVPHSQIHLNDFDGAGQGPNVGLEFKRYKYELLVKEYGVEDIEVAVDNDADVRAMARELGLEAMTPQEAVASVEMPGEDDPTAENAIRAQVDVPAYIQSAADKGLAYYAEGLGGDGLVEQTISDARDLAGGSVTDEKARRMIAWIARHRVDWEGVPQNSDESNENWPGHGAVAALLWGVDPTQSDGADRVVRWAEGIVAALEDREIIDVKELETRALPMGDFTVTEGEDGQKTFTGYAALFNTPSDGMQFTEVIAPNAFSRTLKRVADGKKMISFLFGHDETRALATTASGRLTLTEDARGLKVEAKLDPADPDAASVISKLTHEARSMGMSFGFSIPGGGNGDVWEDNVRTLKEINLFEVSVLSAGQTPAYPATIGLTAVRKLSADKIGVDGDRLMNTLENIKSANPLTEDDLQVIEQVRARLAPKPVGVDPSVALAMLQTKRLLDQEL
jgi:HK97 family phage prohead protease